MGLHHSEGAVGRWWRPEVLGSTISPGAGGGKRKKKNKAEDGSTVFSSSGHLSKQEVGKMLSKALKVRFLSVCVPFRARRFGGAMADALFLPRLALLHARGRDHRFDPPARVDRPHVHFQPPRAGHASCAEPVHRHAPCIRAHHQHGCLICLPVRGRSVHPPCPTLLRVPRAHLIRVPLPEWT